MGKSTKKKNLINYKSAEEEYASQADAFLSWNDHLLAYSPRGVPSVELYTSLFSLNQRREQLHLQKVSTQAVSSLDSHCKLPWMMNQARHVEDRFHHCRKHYQQFQQVDQSPE